jgi:hypothetical protein
MPNCRFSIKMTSSIFIFIRDKTLTEIWLETKAHFEALFAQKCFILASNYYFFAKYLKTNQIDRRRIYENLFKNFNRTRLLVLCTRISVLNFNNAGWPLREQAEDYVSIPSNSLVVYSSFTISFSFFLSVVCFNMWRHKHIYTIRFFQWIVVLVHLFYPLSPINHCSLKCHLSVVTYQCNSVHWYSVYAQFKGVPPLKNRTSSRCIGFWWNFL